MDTREQQLRRWVAGQLGDEPAWSAVAGDASSRRYFRAGLDAGTWIAVDAPPATEKNAEFLAVRELLDGNGLCVPDLHAVELKQGFLLLGDLGETLLLPLLNTATVDQHYQQALTNLLKLQAIPLGEGQLPAYSAAVLTEEFGRFGEWFCAGLLEQPVAAVAPLLNSLKEQLINNALVQPQVLVHRDYHSRNLLLQEDGSQGIIDFQDALHGPLCYDLVSLLKDCYITWPRAQVVEWVESYRERLISTNLEPRPSAAEFLRWFDWIGLQRHLKVLGNFARLALRDQRTDYLQDLPRVLLYISEVLSLYPELEEFDGWFTRELEPRIATQPWSGEP
jgi:aminoglycoside/choline kinase family phosphotransferase